MINKKDKTEIVLEKIENQSNHIFLPIVGRKKGRLLEKLIKKLQPKLVLEIGMLVAFSTILMARNLKQGKIITIEINQEAAEIARKNLNEAGIKNVKVILGNALKIIPKLKSKFDFVFIDAVKEDYLNYLKLIESKLNKNAIIVADNAKIFASEMKDYLDYVRTSKNYKSKFYDFDEDGMEVSIKI
mgnify:FL=1